MDTLTKPTGKVLMVTSPEKAINYKWYDNSDILQPEVQVIPQEDIKSLDDLFGGSVPSLNSVWIKHPFIPNQYIDINTAEDTLTRIKLDALVIIAKYLGVKEYTTLYATEEISERTYDTKVGVQYKTIKADTQVKIDKNDKNSGKYYKHEEFSGSFSQKEYEKAVAKAKEIGLFNDDTIRYLLEQRNPQDANIMKSQTVKIELTRELNESLDVAFALSACELFNLNVNYKQTLSTRKKITIETELVFE